MRTSRAVLIAAFIAWGILGSTATAASFGYEPSRFRIISAGLTTFTEPFATSKCNITLGGTLHQGLINKVEGTLIGYITETAPPSCSSGFISFLRTIPWHIKYASIMGVLPERITLTHIDIEGMALMSGLCLVRSRVRFELAMERIGAGIFLSRQIRSSGAALNNSCGSTTTIVGTFNFAPELTLTRN